MEEKKGEKQKHTRRRQGIGLRTVTSTSTATQSIGSLSPERRPPLSIIRLIRLLLVSCCCVSGSAVNKYVPPFSFPDDLEDVAV